MLGDKTDPQIRSIDKSYHAKYDKTLLELIDSEATLNLKSNCAFSLVHSARLQVEEILIDLWVET